MGVGCAAPKRAVGLPSQPPVLPVPPAMLQEAALQVDSPSFSCTRFGRTYCCKAATTATCPHPPPRARGGQALTPHAPGASWV